MSDPSTFSKQPGIRSGDGRTRAGGGSPASSQAPPPGLEVPLRRAPRCPPDPGGLALLAVLVLLAWTASADPALAADPFSWANQKLSGAKSTALTFLNTLGFFALIGCVAVGMLKKQGWPFAWAGAIFGGLLLANGYAYFSDWFTS